MPAHKIDFYINTSESLRKLARDAQRVAELQQVFVNIAPQALTLACRVKQVDRGTLFLLAENGAIAAKIKQLTPRLLSAYQNQGFEVTVIRVEVQVKEAAPGIIPRPRKGPLSIESIDNLESLAAGLEDSPLKRALTTMAARQRKYYRNID